MAIPLTPRNMLRADCFPAFFADLRSSGFSVGPREQERVVALLLHLESTSTMPQSSKRLSNMLGSILCTNVEQQLEFEQRFSSYFGAWGGHRPEPPPAVAAEGSPEPGRSPREPSIWDSMSEAERRILRRFLAALLLIYLVMVLIGMGFTGGRPTGAKADRPPPLHTTLSNLLSAPQVAWNESSNRLGAWALFLVFPLFACLAYWIAAPARPFSAFLLRRQVRHAQSMVRLLLRGSGPTPFKMDMVQRAIQQLRRPRWVDSEDLAIDATLNATILNAGLFTPVRAPRRMAPEYLVLIDRRSIDDHVAAHADSLVAEFRQALLYVDCYYFNGDPRRVAQSPGAPSVSLDELVSRHPDHRLILVTAGEGLFDTVTGVLHDWTRSFTSFLTGVVLTPQPKSLWGYREEMLRSELDLPIFPLAPESIPRMVSALIGGVQGLPSKARKAPKQAHPALSELFDLLEDRPIRWIDNMCPEASAEEELVRLLKNGLGPDLLRWLQASAAYPALNYRLTQHLHQVVGKTRGAGPSIWEDSVALFSLPWFRKGHLPLWLRRRLIAETTTEDLEQTRHALNKLLLSYLGRSPKTISLDAGMNRPMLPNEKAVLEHLDRRLHDPVLIEFLSRRQRDPTTVRLPRIVARMLAYGGWMHNIFSRAEIDEIESSAEILNENVDQLQIKYVEVDIEPDETIGIDGRRVEKLFDSKDAVQTLGHGCYVYLPVGDAPGRLLDDFTASIYFKRRRMARSLAFANLALVVVLGTTFYGSNLAFAAFGYLGIAVLAAIAWIMIPFWLMSRIGLRPVVSRFSLFPACFPVADGFGNQSLKYRIVTNPHKNSQSSAA
jgi:hypothetical protein